MDEFDTVIVGGGSAGFGAAYASSLSGAKTLLIERMSGLGGVSVFGGVNCWEPGYGGMGVHLRLARDLMSGGQGCVIHDDGGPVGPERPFVWCLPTKRGYSGTFKVPDPAHVHDTDHFMFEPEAMSSLMLRYLRENGCSVMLDTGFAGAECRGRYVGSLTLRDKSGKEISVRGKTYIDCTDGASLAGACGCARAIGEESGADHGEYSAPDSASAENINGVSLIFRCAPDPGPYIPAAARADDGFLARLERREIYSVINQYPDGDINVNMLPTMNGREYAEAGAGADRILRERAAAYFGWLRENFGLRYRMKNVFPMHGVRESYRLVGRYVLSENDLRAGMYRQDHKERLIAFADHMIDVHGTSSVKRKLPPDLDIPYGIPYECLLPQEYDNMLVASHASSFSHIAAASARLSRTMIAVGEAAGYASAMAAEEGKIPADIDIAELRKRCRIDDCVREIESIWR